MHWIDCEQQSPAMRPEPFYPNGPPTAPGIDGPGANNVGPNDVDYTETEAIYAENQSSATTTSKRRPPATFSVGKPHKPPGIMTVR